MITDHLPRCAAIKSACKAAFYSGENAGNGYHCINS